MFSDREKAKETAKGPLKGGSTYTRAEPNTERVKGSRSQQSAEEKTVAPPVDDHGRPARKSTTPD